MVSSSYENLGFDSAVANMYTASSVAKLVKTTINEAIKSSDDNSEAVKDYIKNSVNGKQDTDVATVDYNDENSAQTIADVLKDYTKKSSEYIKEMYSNKNTNAESVVAKNGVKDFESYTKEDYDKAGMSGYYTAKFNLSYSKALTNYMKNYGPSVRINTFNFSV